MSDNDVTDNPSAPVATGYIMRKDGMRFRVVIGVVQWMSDRNGNLITFSSPDAYNRPRQIKDPLGRNISIEYAYPAPQAQGHTDEDWIKFSGGTAGTTERVIKVRYAALGSLFRDGGTQVKKVRELFTDSDCGGCGANESDHNPMMVNEIVLPGGQQKYSFRYNEYGELAKANLPTGGGFEYDWIPRTTQFGGQYGELMVYRRLSMRRVYSSAGIEEGRVVYDAPVLGSGGPNLVVTATEKDPSGTTLRIAESTFWGDPLAAANTPVHGFPRWKDGRSFQEDVKKPDGTLMQRNAHTWRNRHPSTYQSIDPSDAASPLDTRIIETQRTLGSVTSKTTMSYTLDAFNNLAERCEYDFGMSQIIRCTKLEYETGSTYTGTGVHLRALVKTEGTYIGGNTVKEAETKYIYDAGTPNNCPGIAEHDPSRGTGYTTRGNPTTIERWCNTCGDDPWVRSVQVYDIAGNVVQVTHPKVMTESDAVAPVTTVAYTDAYDTSPLEGPTFAFPTLITHPGGLTTSATFHYQLGRIKSFTDPNGKVTNYAYGESDVLDRLTTVTHPIGQSKFAYSYSSGTSETQITSQKSQTTGVWITDTNYLDGLGRQKRSIPAAAGTVQTEYDALGRVKRVSGNGTTPTAYTYDVLDRQVNLTYEADNSQVCTGYAGAETVVRDPADVWRKNLLDGLGRLVSVVEDPTASIDGCGSNTGTNLATAYGYDARGNLLSVNQGGRARAFTYDTLARLLTVTVPEWGSEGQASGTTAYAYDEAGNLTTRTDPRNTITTLRYNIRGQIRTKAYTAGSDTAATPNVTYCYDGDVTGVCADGPTGTNLLGRLTQVVTSASRMKYASFDNLGRVTTSRHELNGTDYQFTYGYNDVAMTSLTYPSGRVVSYGYDSAGRIATVSGLKSGVTTNYVQGVSYTTQGAMDTLTLANGRYEKRCYNGRLAVTDIVLRTAAPSGCVQGAGNAATLRYTYSTGTDNGNVASQQIGDGAAWSVTQSYAYDKLNRLQSAAEGVSGPGWKYTFGYDAWGNGWVDTTPTESYGLLTDGNRPNAGSWFTAKNRLNLGTNSYDLAGNQKQFNPWTLGHDAENRMVQAAKTGLTETYAYDGEGRRVKKVSGDLTTYYVYTADGELAAEYEVGSGGGSMPCTTCYLFADHLGSTRAVWDSNGVKARYDWAPFGEAVAADRNGRTGVLCGGASCFGMTGPLKQKFSGKERDQETGLDYFGARYMSAGMGRFASADPSPLGISVGDPQSWNLYTYVRNRTTTNIDTSGQWATYIHADINSVALSGYLSAGQIAVLNARAYALDKDVSTEGANDHGLRTPRQSPAEGRDAIWSKISSEIKLASPIGDRGDLSTFELMHLGDAIHAVQDITSPSHTSSTGVPAVWGGLSPGVIGHGIGEALPSTNWSRIGVAIRYTLATFLQAAPKIASAKGLTSETIDSISAGRISEYVERAFRLNHILRGPPNLEDAARQCALGNPAACGNELNGNPF